MHRADELAQRLGARRDDLDRPLDRDLARQAVQQRPDLLGDERLERLAVAQRVVDREPERLVVAPRAEAGDRRDDALVVGVVAVGREHAEVLQPREHVLGHVVAAGHVGA